MTTETKNDTLNFVYINKKYFDEERFDIISRALSLLIVGAVTKHPEVDLKETYVTVSKNRNLVNDRVEIELKLRESKKD